MVEHGRDEEKNCEITQTQLQANHGAGREKSPSWVQNTTPKDSAEVKIPNVRDST